VVAGAAAGGWAATRPTAASAPSYRLVTASRTTLRQTLSVTGTIEPATTKTLGFTASGQVTTVDATVGEHVTEGETLAILDSASLRAQAAQAQATLAGAQSRLSQDRSSDAPSAQLAADEASVSAAQSQVDSANDALSGATLTSPVDGIVTTVGLTAGEQLTGGAGASGASGGGGGGSGGGQSDGGQSDGGGSDGGSGGSGGSGTSGTSGGSGSGSSGSITVVSANDVINASVNASVVDQIKTGDQVTISTEGTAGPVSGTVASIGLIASVSSGVATFPVVIDVTGTPSGLYAGASATASIVYNQLTNVIAVPAAAVTVVGGKTVVYTMTDGRQVPRPVTTGLTTGGMTRITGGLTAGEQVVLNITTINLGPGSGNGGGLVGPGNFPGPGQRRIVQFGAG
jgi:macrolide-specific efflux system membrane fusion protein